MSDETDAEPRTHTISDGDECALCDKPMSEARNWLEDELRETLYSAESHGLPAWAVASALLHAVLDVSIAEEAARWLLRAMETEAPRLREIVEPLLLMAIKRRGAREDA